MAGDDLVMSNAEIQSTINGARSDDSGDVDMDVDEGSSLDSDAEIPSWEDEQPGDDLEAADADEDVPAPAKKRAQTIREIKANGKVHQVDMRDQAAVDRILSLGLGARQLFSEHDKVKKQAAQLTQQNTDLQRYKGLWDKLESMKGNREALYERIFGEKFADAVSRERERADRYASATPEERRFMDYQAKMESMQREWEDKQKSWQEKEKDVETRAEKAEISEVKSVLTPAFHKYEFTSKVDDPDRAEMLNAMLWRTALHNLKQLGDDAEITPALADREFARVARAMLGNAEKAAQKEVKKTIDEKKKVAKSQAQVAATRNYTGSQDIESLSKRAKDPVDLFRRLYKNK